MSTGLTTAEAQARLAQYGFNQTARIKRKIWPLKLLHNLRNPLVVLLAVLTIVSVLTGDPQGATIMASMIVLGVGLRSVQELNADHAADKLQAMVSTNSEVLRDGKEQSLPMKLIVPGDVIVLAAGDVVPADVCLITAKDLFVNQSALTGESMASEKAATPAQSPAVALECRNLCFQGTHVETGTAMAVAVRTGTSTYFARLAADSQQQQSKTSFDKGIDRFTWLMIAFIMVMVPLVFLLNGILKHNWLEAFMFALAVGVGLTPEMLPMIVTVNLSKGAIAMSRKKVIIKHLEAIQNLGAMDVLCTDKTGTLTQGKVYLEKHLGIDGHPSGRVLNFAFLNSFYQTGLRNMMDVAVLEHEEMRAGKAMEHTYKKIDEIPFDFERRRMSVVVENAQGSDLLICKGAVEEMMSLCTTVEEHGKPLTINDEHKSRLQTLVSHLNADGFRVLALAIKQMTHKKPAYEAVDEKDMTLLGLLAFLDPPKETAKEALDELAALGISVKVLTGDNDAVTGKICRQVGLHIDRVVLGAEIDRMSDDQLAETARTCSAFAKLAPSHKARLIKVLQSTNHVVGFLGDGINDAPALRAADVGISVDQAVDIARESSDVILLEKSLLVLKEGIVTSRTVFCNIIKYIKMAASSNFGNMFSVVGASAFLPFLPMLPLQILVNNLLYDFSQTAIPTDNVDQELLLKPRQWSVDNIRKFILAIGPLSSIFDYATFFVMLQVFQCWKNPTLFHTGWFVESVLTQTLIIHVIRTNKIPFVQSSPSAALLVTSLIIAAVGAWLPYSPLAGALRFAALPALYWPIIAAFLLSYVVLTQIVKSLLIKRIGAEGI